MPIGALIGGALPGLIKAGGSLFGGRARRNEQKAAQQGFDESKDALRNHQFTNAYANQENTAEDLTVNQDATNVQSQNTDQALSQGLDAITAGGGGGGGAQAIAAAALQSKQGISADIAGQESQNQQLRAQQAASNQDQAAAGDQALQQKQYDQKGLAYDQDSERLGAANAARQQATAALTEGLGSAVGGALGAPTGGSGGFLKDLAGGLKSTQSPVQRNSPLHKDKEEPKARTYKDRYEREEDKYGEHDSITAFQESRSADRFNALNDRNLGGSFTKSDAPAGDGPQGYRDLQSGRQFFTDKRGRLVNASGSVADANDKFNQGIEARIRGGVDKSYANQFEEEQRALGNRSATGYQDEGKTLQQQLTSRDIAAGGSVRDASMAANQVDRENRSRNKAIHNTRGVQGTGELDESAIEQQLGSPVTRKSPLSRVKGGVASMRKSAKAMGYQLVKMK